MTSSQVFSVVGLVSRQTDESDSITHEGPTLKRQMSFFPLFALRHAAAFSATFGTSHRESLGQSARVSLKLSHDGPGGALRVHATALPFAFSATSHFCA